DRPSEVEPLTGPGREARARRDAQTVRIVDGLNWRDHISGAKRRRGRIQQRLSVRPPEVNGAIDISCDSIPLLVNRPMVAPAEHHEIGERRRAALRPMPDVVSLAHPHAAAWKPTALVTMLERAPEGRRNRPGSRRHLHGPPVRAVAHEYAVGVTGESLRRFS